MAWNKNKRFVYTRNTWLELHFHKNRIFLNLKYIPLANSWQRYGNMVKTMYNLKPCRTCGIPIDNNGQRTRPRQFCECCLKKRRSDAVRRFLERKRKR